MNSHAFIIQLHQLSNESQATVLPPSLSDYPEANPRDPSISSVNIPSLSRLKTKRILC